MLVCEPPGHSLQTVELVALLLNIPGGQSLQTVSPSLFVLVMYPSGHFSQVVTPVALLKLLVSVLDEQALQALVACADALPLGQTVHVVRLNPASVVVTLPDGQTWQSCPLPSLN